MPWSGCARGCSTARPRATPRRARPSRRTTCASRSRPSRRPTLVIVGDQDPSTPPDHARFIAAQVQGARLVELERARHLLNVEHPDRVTQELLAHFTEEDG